MNTDSILNIIFFFVGLAIGLLQLYIGQHQFEVQQREKMDELRKILADIQQRIAVLEEMTSQRVFEVQDKLIRLATGKEDVAEFTEDVAKKVHEIVATELKEAGVHETIKLTKSLDSKLTHVLQESASSFVEDSLPTPTIRESQFLLLISRGLTDQEISKELRVSMNYVHSQLARLKMKYRAVAKNRAELAALYIMTLKPLMDAKVD